jgi:hypothetical protein
MPTEISHGPAFSEAPKDELVARRRTSQSSFRWPGT